VDGAILSWEDILPGSIIPISEIEQEPHSSGSVWIVQRSKLPGVPIRRAGIRPARTSDDFPMPEGPITARKRLIFNDSRRR
jgi:hypothetical protein